MPADQRLPGALSSGAFRFALLLAAVFALGSALLLWAVERQVNSYAAEATNVLLRNEATALADQFRGEGLPGLKAAIRNRGNAADSPYHYLLVDAGGHRLAGGLPVSAARVGWQTGFEAEAGDQRARMRHLGTRLPGDLLLVVATDTFDIENTRDRLEIFTLSSGIGIVLFAMLGGMVAGRMFLGRLERINRAVGRIIAGSSTERLPMIGIGPEFDHLTHNLNLMIERQAAAVEGLRQVSTAIAHELRTPLSRLKQRLESMRDAETASPAALDEAIAQIDGTLSTFQSLLRISMLEGGAGRQRFGPVDLTELMDRVYQVYLPVAEDSGHMLLADDLSQAIVGGDGELLAQLLTNLVENALSHTPPGTRTWLSLRREEQAVVVSVSDDGPGVAPEDRDKLFTKFYRASGHGNTSGAGLGLSLVAAIADLHGAAYRILPSRPGFCVEVTFRAMERDQA